MSCNSALKLNAEETIIFDLEKIQDETRYCINMDIFILAKYAKKYGRFYRKTTQLGPKLRKLTHN